MAFLSLKFCFVCKKAIEVEEDRCPKCGLQLREHRGKKLFLSGRSGSENIPIHLESGTFLMERFEIKRFIANGRYGSVYLAKDNLRSIEVALKVIGIGPSGNGGSILRSRSEAMVYERISDFSHIIKLCDTHSVPWGASGLLLLSMEFADGGTFREWLMKHQEDLQARTGIGLDYFKQVCRGVLSLHISKVLHLDLKPENMVFLDGKLKISDLGAAMSTERLKRPNDVSYETTPLVTGTPGYMAPECFDSQGTEIDQRADIYSLGVMLYELLDPKGHPPFVGTHAQLRDLHCNASIPQLSETNEKLLNALHRCLAKKPENRYQSMEEFLEDLDEESSPFSLGNEHLPECETRDSNQIEEIWQRASLSFSDGELKDASRFVDEVLFLQPGHSKAQQLKEEINARFNQADQIYQKINGNLDDGDLNELVNLIEEASEIYPEHPSGVVVQTRLSASAKRFCKSMEAGMLAFQERQWELALGHFREAYALNSGAIQLKPIIEQLSQLEEARKKTDIALMNGNFEEAERLACFIDLKGDQMISQLKFDQ